MLILTRRVGESIIIGDNEMEVMVISVNAHTTRIGIRAPKNVTVHRKEIHDKLQRQKKKVV